MATTKESMKVIAGGLDKKEEPEIVIGGKVIALEVPEELTEIFDNLAYSLIGRCRRPIDEEPECDPDKEESREDNVEYSETWKLAARISEGLAERAADNLMKIAENLTVETMVAITKYLLSMDAEKLIPMLKGLFLSHGMYDAASELDFMDICMEYEEDAAYFFEDAFFDTDSMDWYSVESIIRDRTAEYNNKLN